MVNAQPSPERGPKGAPAQPEKVQLVVNQPQKLEGILQQIESLPSEDVSGKIGEQGGGAGGPAATSAQGLPSPRDQAIAGVPPQPQMQRELQKHIKKEIRNLHREANRIVKISRPGAAAELNEIFARIRRLYRLLEDIMEASYDALKRLFIRVFVDKQPVL